jgi:hypothetical protein
MMTPLLIPHLKTDLDQVIRPESRGPAVNSIQIQPGFCGHHRTSGGQTPFDCGDVDIRPQAALQGKCLKMAVIRPIIRPSQIQMGCVQSESAVAPEKSPVLQIDGWGIDKPLNALHGRALG